MTRKNMSLAGWTPEQKKARQREQQRQWMADHPGYGAEYAKRVAANYRANFDWKKDDVLKHSEKYAARVMLRHAVKYGYIEPGPCEICAGIAVEGHHPDYKKPFEVIWLCREHHLMVHVGMNRIDAAKSEHPVFE